ncbi:hypothetical protein BY996DRAFT_7266641 [Phakopsora pachyrhizi]|nr:hypothetical protein BY996DRAFT_7266641 [Phakopsora pachyrhizi]
MRTENSTPKDRLFGQTYLKNDFETLEDFRTFESSGSNEGFASPDREPHTNETTPSPDSLTKTFVHSSRERSFKSRAGKEWNVEGSSFGQISEHSTAPHLSRPESSTKHMGQDSVYSATRRQILCSPPRCNTAQSIIIQQSGIRSVVPRGSRASTFETAMASNCSKNSGLESIVESTSSPNLAEKKVSSWRVAAITSPAQGRSFSSMSRNYKNPSILSGSENGSMGYGAQLGADETVSAFGGRSIASGRVGSSGGERPIDYKAMTKLELFLLATKNRAKLDSVSSQFAVEKEGLLDALQELEEECHSATKERDQLLAELEQNTSSANKIEDQELLRELERAREEIFRLQSQVNQLELANSRLENRANSMANELKRAVVDLRTTTSTVSLKSQIPQSLIGKAVDRGSRTEKVELRAAERDKGKIRQKTVLLNPPVIGDLHDRSSNRSTLSPQRASFNKLDEQRSSLLAMNSALSQCSVSLNNTTFKFGSECSLSDDGAEDEDGFGRLTLIQTGGRKPLFSSSIEEQEEDAAEENREEGEEPYGVEVDGGQDHEEEKQEDEDEKDSDEEKYHDVNYDHEGTESTSPCSTVFADHRTRRRRDGGGSRYHDLGGEESSQYYDQNHSGRRGGVSKNNGSGSVNDRNYGIGRSLGNDEDEDNYDFRGSTGMDIGLELKREDQIFLEDLEDHDQLVLNESYGDGAESVF